MQITTTKAVKCLVCGSAARTRYHDVRRIKTDEPGFTHLVIRRTTCAKCGEPRIEQSYEHEIIKRPKGPATA